jgi:3-oxoacyl-[acyl-carrier protein] reductase
LLSDKIIVVTGAGRGIGRACAELFALNGAFVIINTRSEISANKAKNEILEKYPNTNIDTIAFDVKDYDAVKAGFVKINSKYKRIDVLVNNAGILRDSLIGMVTEDLIEDVMANNFKGTFYCAQMAIRIMTKAKSGSVINISSIIGRQGNSGQSIYAASKAAVLGLTYSFSKEVAPLNIRVNAVAPGFIQTDMTQELPHSKREEIINGIKMKRIGTALDVANTCLFLASDLSTYVTGQVIGVDGGMTI